MLPQSPPLPINNQTLKYKYIGDQTNNTKHNKQPKLREITLNQNKQDHNKQTQTT